MYNKSRQGKHGEQMVRHLAFGNRMRALEVKGLAAAVANHLGISDTYAILKRKLAKSQVVVVAYHRVLSEKDDFEPLNTRTRMDTRAFESQLRYLSQNFEIISLGELAQCLLERKALPGKAVVVTFDDGWKDSYLLAYPILRKYGVPATIFLATGYVGTGKPFWWHKVLYVLRQSTVKRLDLGELGCYSLQSEADRSRAAPMIIEELKRLPEQEKELLLEKLATISQVEIPEESGHRLVLSWEEVQEMSRNGIDFGAHSVTHPILTRVSLRQARWEISQSKRDIERRIGKAVNFFAYPDGVFNAEVAKAVEESGFTGAVTDEPRWINPRTNLYGLGRIFPDGDFDKFKVVLSGLWGDLKVMLGR